MSEGVSSIGSCMHFSAVAPGALSQAGFEALSWVASGEVTNIGEIGPENEVVKFTTLCDGNVNKRMGSTDYGQQSLELAYKSTNGAQEILQDASVTKQPIYVKEALASGDIMYYTAYVAKFKTLVGGGSDYLRASVSLEVDGAIVPVYNT